MARALIIAGNELRFLKEAGAYQRLFNQCGIATEPLLRTAYLEKSDVEKTVARAVRKTRAEELVIVYVGHGSEEGWGIHAEIVPYRQIVPLFSARLRNRNPLLLINDCCHAYALAETCQSFGLQNTNVGVVAACNTDEEARSGLSNDIATAWIKQQIYTPPKPYMWCMPIAVHWIPDEAVVEVTTSNGDTVASIPSFGRPVERRKGPKIKIFREYAPHRWGARIDHFFYAPHGEAL